MVYLQRNIPKLNKIYNFSLSNFSGGLNNRSDVLEDNESPDLLNMMFTSDDIMSKRNGQIFLNSDDYEEPITFIDEYIGASPEFVGLKWGESKWGDKFVDSTTNLVVATNSKLYINNNFITDVTSKVSGVSHIGNYYFVDGGNMFVYGSFPKNESTYIKIIGEHPNLNTSMKVVSPPTGYIPLDRIDVDSGGEGDITPTSTSKVKVLEINTTSPISVLLDDGNWYELIIYDGMAIDTGKYYAASFQGSKVKLYPASGGDRHLTGVTVYDFDNNLVWYEPCLFEIEDEYKGENVVPPNVRYIVNHKGRLFVSGDDSDDNNIFITDIENPYYFPVGLPIQVPPDSDKIVNLIIYDDSVIVARQRDIYVLSGMTNRLDLGLELFTLRKLNTHTGFINSTSANLAHNYLFFIGNDGNAYALSSLKNEERIMVTSILNQTIDFFTSPINLSHTDLEKTISYFHNDYWYVQIKDKTFIYSYRNRAWTLFSNINATSFFSLYNNIIWGRSDGRLAEFSDEYLDFGKPFEAYWSSKNFDVDFPNEYKHFRNFFVVSEVLEDFDSDVYISFFIDYFDSNDYKLISHKSSKWGFSNFGDVLLNHNIIHSTPYYINRRGRNIRFVLRNGYNESGVVDLPGHLYAYPNKKNGELIYVRLEDAYYLYHTSHIDDSYKGGSVADEIRAMGWRKLSKTDINQSMKVFQINFNYEDRRRYI